MVPKWGMYVESQRQAGREMRHAEDGLQAAGATCTSGRRSTDAAERRKAWDEILTTNAERGVLDRHGERDSPARSSLDQKVRNVPEKGYHAWDPGGYIGLYQPDTFWISQ